MSSRKLLLLLGIVFVGAGLWLAQVRFRNISVSSPQAEESQKARPAILTALTSIPSGTLLRENDFGWKEIKPGKAQPGQITRGSVSKNEYLGAITRKDFSEGEALSASQLVKTSDRRFLAAVLHPGYRAVSISVDAPQTASGLVLPGDYVDVILVQNFGDNVATAAHRSVGETVLRNVRVVAVDRSLETLDKADGNAKKLNEVRVPKTITLEANEQQAQKLFVAMQLGKLQLAVRPLQGAAHDLTEENHSYQPVWASDVSYAIRQMSVTGLRPTSSGSTVERAVRRPPPTFVQ